MNHSQTYSYNARGMNTGVLDAANGMSTAVYDTMGNLTRLTGPTGATTHYTYDNMGRLSTETTASGGTIRYEYDELNLKDKLTNARGQVKTYVNDAMGRVSGIVSTQDTVSYTYDDNGNVKTVTDSNGTITRDYDALNRVSRYVDTFGREIGYQYDAVGNLQRITYPDDTYVTYGYDENNNLTSVTDWQGRITSYGYNENNQVVTVTKPDGSVTTTVYDDRQRIWSTVERTAGGAIITGYEYTYDTIGRISSEKHLAQDVTLWYTYDALSRVTKRTVKNACNTVVSEETYTYDAAGNITDAPDSCFGYGTNNRLTTFMERSVSYDADGNMLSARLGGANMALSYDASNRLVSAGGHTYTYNAEDVRIRNVCNGYDTTYTYNTNGRLSQLLLKTTNGITTKYVYGLGLIGEEKCGEFKTYHFDYRGSTVALTDECGSITDTFEYDTYGNVTERTGDSFVIFGYNGRDGVVTDKNGLIYMRARYYSPEMRRFVNADILRGEISDSTSLNRYSYVNGNPVSFVDPFGLAAEEHESTDISTVLTSEELLALADICTTFGFSTVGLQISKELLYESLKNSIKTAVRPNNIGKGWWNKLVKESLNQVDELLGPISKTTQVLEFISLPWLDAVSTAATAHANAEINISNNVPTSHVIADAAADMGIGLFSTWASTAVGTAVAAGAAAGSIVPGAGTAAGAVAGLIIGVGISVTLDCEIYNGKSIEDYTKDAVRNIFDGVGNWLEGLFD